MWRVGNWVGLLIFLIATQAFAGQFEEGLSAAKKGDYARAVKLWGPLARHGNVKAQYNLGLMYHKGLGVAKDDHAAARWWRKAAEHGDAIAQANLGSMYNFGLGVPRNSKQAAKWYQSAANKGNVTAQYNLGFMFLKGNGRPRNYRKAMYWFRRAANKGDVYSRFYMGFMYEYGQGVRVDPVAAYALYSLAAANRHQNNNLASNYRNRLTRRISHREIEKAQRLTRRLLMSYPMTKALDAYLVKRK